MEFKDNLSFLEVDKNLMYRGGEDFVSINEEDKIKSQDDFQKFRGASNTTKVYHSKSQILGVHNFDTIMLESQPVLTMFINAEPVGHVLGFPIKYKTIRKDSIRVEPINEVQRPRTIPLGQRNNQILNRLSMRFKFVEEVSLINYYSN